MKLKINNPFKKSSKNESEKISISFYLPIIITFSLSIYVYSKCDNFMIAGLILISGLIISLLTKNVIAKPNKEKNDVMDFYNHFLIYSSLEENYLDGLNLAISNMPLTPLKDKLVDYQEAENKSELPLTISNTREEYNLISYIELLLRTNEEYSSISAKILKDKIDAFSNRTDYPNIQNKNPLYLLFSIEFLLIFLSIINYE